MRFFEHKMMSIEQSIVICPEICVTLKISKNANLKMIYSFLNYLRSKFLFCLNQVNVCFARKYLVCIIFIFVCGCFDVTDGNINVYTKLFFF